MHRDALTRAFLALRLPAAIEAGAERELEHCRRVVPPGAVRWVPPRNFHLTLRFFGDLDAEGLERATETLRAFDRRFASIPCRLGEVSAFPSRQRPQVIWIAIDSERDALADLARAVDAALITAGFGPPDKPWKSHLTLGRVNRGAVLAPAVTARLFAEGGDGRASARRGDLVPRVDTMTLFRSELLPGGPRYASLAEARAAD